MKTKTTKKNLVNNSNQPKWEPSKKWFKTYRREITDQFMNNNIEYSLENDNWVVELIDLLDDNEYLCSNYPSFTKSEVIDYLYNEYEQNSKFMFRLKRFLNKESLKMKIHPSKLSDEQKEWVDENLYW